MVQSFLKQPKQPKKHPDFARGFEGDLGVYFKVFFGGFDVSKTTDTPVGA